MASWADKPQIGAGTDAQVGDTTPDGFPPATQGDVAGAAINSENTARATFEGVTRRRAPRAGDDEAVIALLMY